MLQWITGHRCTTTSVDGTSRAEEELDNDHSITNTATDRHRVAGEERSMNDVKTVTVTPAQDRFADWMRDVLVYTVVLNLFVEFSDAIVIDSFTISIFTAVVLKILLDILTMVEHHVSHFFSKIHRVLGFLSMWAVLFLSKFVILEVIDIIFGDHVELGKLLDVILLVLALMISRALVVKAYDSLGVQDPDDAPAAA
ncbi:hypothetical protein [Ilumatobacter sp.]|uniref:hypothetical protein n=1 Tax=Ilumatobacter sp. TaxID=1967498 RepID=UPI003AF6B242